jgi:hypothetical protein
MRENTHLSAMVGFVRKHVAEHFHAHWPRPSPTVSAKLLDAAPTTECFSQHLRAASGALSQSRTGLLRRAVQAVELRRNLQVRSRKPDPLSTDIVHVREDRRNGADLAGRFGSPGGRVKVLDKNLVHAIIGGKNLDRGSIEFSLHVLLTRGHGAPAAVPMILPVNLRTDRDSFGLTFYPRDISAARDPVTISLVAVMLLTVAGLSLYLRRKAASVDPVLVLREE